MELMNNRLNLSQCANLIATVPSVRFMLTGNPGIGKSSVMEELKRRFPSYSAGYIDVGNLDLGDTVMPMPDKELKVTSYYPNEIFNVHLGKPVILMLDEFTKGSQSVKNMLHPMLEVNNPRLGNVPIHPDSIIFLTGNGVDGGLGDSMKAHSMNRISELEVRSPTSDEWISWGINNGIDESVLAWIREFNHALADYRDEGQESNPYIFNPRKGQITHYVSPRSLEKASDIIKKRSELDDMSLMSALSGTIGKQAAVDMQAFIEFKDQLPNFDEVCKTPDKVNVPKTLGPKYVFVYASIARITNDNLENVMKYLRRFEVEFQALFAVCLSKVESKRDICLKNKNFENWIKENIDII